MRICSSPFLFLCESLIELNLVWLCSALLIGFATEGVLVMKDDYSQVKSVSCLLSLLFSSTIALFLLSPLFTSFS